MDEKPFTDAAGINLINESQRNLMTGGYSVWSCPPSPIRPSPAEPPHLDAKLEDGRPLLATVLS